MRARVGRALSLFSTGGGGIRPGILLLCVGGLPALYALLNDAWIYSGFGFADAHINVSLGRRFLDYAYRLEPELAYKTSRVPLILIQAMLRGALSPVAAQVVLALAPILSIGLLLWLITSRALGRTTAALVTSITLASSYLYVLRYTGGTDYMNSIGAALALLAVERFAHALRHGKVFAWLVFGATFAAAFFTNALSACALSVLCAVELVASVRRFELGSVARAGLGAASGLALSTMGFSLACGAAGKGRTFFGPQLAQLADAWRKGDQDLPIRAGFAELLSRPGYEHLAVGAAILVVALVLLARQAVQAGRTGDWRGHLASRPALYCAQFVLVSGFFLWDKSRGGILLDMVHHSHPLLLCMCLAVGGIHALLGTTPGAWHAAVAWAAVAGGAALDLVWPHVSPTVPLRAGLVSGAAVLSAVLLWAVLSRRHASIALACLALGCGWATAAGGELLRYDPYGLNEAIYLADHELWDTLRVEGPRVVNHVFSYSGPGLVDVALSPDRHPRRATVARLVDLVRRDDDATSGPSRGTAMSAARFANALHYSIGMLFLGPIEIRADPAPYPFPPDQFVFYEPLDNLSIGSPAPRDVAVVVFGYTDQELRQLLELLYVRGCPMTVRRSIELRTEPFTLRGYLLVGG